MRDIWFTSDTHFMDMNCLIRENRPFKSVYAFDRHVLKLWDSQISEDDTLYHLGDFTGHRLGNKSDKAWREGLAYVQNIKCDVVLIIGNNEQAIIDDFYSGNIEPFRTYCLNLGFKEVCRNKILDIDDNTCYYLTHKPSDHKKGMVNLFGHLHRSTGFYKPFGLNLSCDLNHFYLYDMMEVQRLLEQKGQYWEKDRDVLI